MVGIKMAAIKMVVTIADHGECSGYKSNGGDSAGIVGGFDNGVTVMNDRDGVVVWLMKVIVMLVTVL